MTLDVLKSEALKLRRTELFDFAQFILEALKSEETSDSDELSPAWKAEILRRREEITNGTATFYSPEQIQAELNKEFGFDLTVSQ